MSLRPKSILCIRSDKWASICAYCDKAEGGAGLRWAEDHGYEASHTYCEPHTRAEYPFQWESVQARKEGRPPCYVLGEHNLPNGRTYHVTDTGFPLATMDGKTEVGGYIVEGDGESLRFATSLAVAAYLEGAKGLPRVYAEAIL